MVTTPKHQLPEEVKVIPCVQFNRPDWYQNPDWVRYINAPGIATWHDPSKHNPTEYSDVFFTYDHGEGSDWGGNGPDSIPDSIWKEICETLGPDAYCLVWVTNLMD
jgi:hypothetical protein